MTDITFSTSVAVFADIGDRVAIAPSETLTLELSGPFAGHAPGDASDLALRAATAFFAHTQLAPAVSIAVEKNIPAGAGLGGGSADAAAVLAGLNRSFKTGLSADALRTIGLALGADVPMCLEGRALRARGVGEIIDALDDWPPLPLVLVWPGRAISTAEVFKALARRDNPPLKRPPPAGDARDAAEWLVDCRNDLEPAARALAPEITAALDALLATEGCMVARMSGSGSACFGLYAEREEAEAAAAEIAARQPQWWVRATEAH